MHFCYFLVREQTYADVKQRLVPRWKDVLSQHPDLDPHIPFSQLPAPFTRWKALKQGYKTRTEVTMGKLVRWVVGHERQFAGDRSATNDLLHDLGLDAPGRSTSEQFGDFPEKFSEAGPSENP